MDNDVDGEGAAPRAIDAENSRFGAISAARRVARAIFMGSAPHARRQTARGLEDMRVRLGVAQPGESVAIFNDATGRMANQLTHLYTGAGRYWYDTQPNLRRTMEDRAVNLEPEKVETESSPPPATNSGTGKFQSRSPLSSVGGRAGRTGSSLGDTSTRNRTPNEAARFSGTDSRNRNFRQAWGYPENLSQYAHLRRS